MLKSFTTGNKQHTVQSAITQLRGIPRPGRRARIARGRLLDGREYRLYLCNSIGNRLFLDLRIHSDDLEA